MLLLTLKEKRKQKKILVVNLQVFSLATVPIFRSPTSLSATKSLKNEGPQAEGIMHNTIRPEFSPQKAQWTPLLNSTKTWIILTKLLSSCQLVHTFVITIM